METYTLTTQSKNLNDSFTVQSSLDDTHATIPENLHLTDSMIDSTPVTPNAVYSFIFAIRLCSWPNAINSIILKEVKGIILAPYIDLSLKVKF